MEKKRAKRGGEYYFIIVNFEVMSDYEYGTDVDNLRFDNNNYFTTKEEAEAVAEKIRAVFAGADIIEDWQKEKINSWDCMLETKNEMSKAVDKYWKLRTNPKINAVLKGADVIEVPGEAEILDAAEGHIEACDEEGHPYSDKYDAKAAFVNGVEWLKSKIIK